MEDIALWYICQAIALTADSVYGSGQSLYNYVAQHDRTLLGRSVHRGHQITLDSMCTYSQAQQSLAQV